MNEILRKHIYFEGRYLHIQTAGLQYLPAYVITEIQRIARLARQEGYSVVLHGDGLSAARQNPPKRRQTAESTGISLWFNVVSSLPNLETDLNFIKLRGDKTKGRVDIQSKLIAFYEFCMEETERRNAFDWFRPEMVPKKEKRPIHEVKRDEVVKTSYLVTPEIKQIMNEFGSIKTSAEGDKRDRALDTRVIPVDDSTGEMAENTMAMGAIAAEDGNAPIGITVGRDVLSIREEDLSALVNSVLTHMNISLGPNQLSYLQNHLKSNYDKGEDLDWTEVNRITGITKNQLAAFAIMYRLALNTVASSGRAVRGAGETAKRTLKNVEETAHSFLSEIPD